MSPVSLAALAALASVGFALPKVSNFIADKYIVTLRDGISASEKEAHISWLARVHLQNADGVHFVGVEHSYNISNFQGYAGSFDEHTVMELMANADVKTSADPSDVSKC